MSVFKLFVFQANNLNTLMTFQKPSFCCGCPPPFSSCASYLILRALRGSKEMLGGMGFCSVLAQPFDDAGDDLKNISHNAQVGDFENGSGFILVDGYDVL